MSVITSADMVILEGRKRGRPRASEPRSTVSAWIPVSDHDRLIKAAEAQAMSVSEYVGVVLRRDLRARLEPSR